LNFEEFCLTPLDQFWNIVETVHRASNGDMDRKCKLLDAELRRLTLDEVRAFQSEMVECERRAFRWELWAAACIIGGGCDHDGFSDFRSTLISMGREVFERALADPQSLADMDYDAQVSRYEGYKYVADNVLWDLTDGEWIPSGRPYPTVPPTAPSGRRWADVKFAEVYPKLAAKYGYSDGTSAKTESK
jgi:hypothetical protein